MKIKIYLAILMSLLRISEGKIYEGSICGFGDVDLNMKTDLIIAKGADKRTLSVLFAEEKTLDFEDKEYEFNFPSPPEAGWTIVNCAILDFDGNSKPDILVSWTDKAKESTQMFVCTTKNSASHSVFNCTNYWGTVKSQPSVGNYEATKKLPSPYSDSFFYVDKNGNGTCVEGGVDKREYDGKACFRGETLERDPMTVYAPITQGTVPNFAIASEKKVDIWKWTSLEEWTKGDTLTIEQESAKLGFMTVGDFNADGVNELLIPRAECAKDVCTKVILHFVSGGLANQSSEVTLDLKEGYSVTLSDEPGIGNFHVRIGDFSLDGYPDFLLILKNAKGASFVFLAHNIPDDSNILGRSFQFDWEFNLNSVPGLRRAVFFDLGEDGDLDIMTESNNGTTDLIEFIYSRDKGDTNFFRVQAFTPACGDAEASVASTGASLYYHSVNEKGAPIHGVYTQGSQTSYGALLLPYALFGLGRTPNFVESLEVALPRPEGYPLTREWLQLIPNSRIFVIPCGGNPGNWVTKLLLTPDKIILQSFAVLCAICGVILIIILVLQLKERREDKRQREQESHKFHFDAM